MYISSGTINLRLNNPFWTIIHLVLYRIGIIFYTHESNPSSIFFLHRHDSIEIFSLRSFPIWKDRFDTWQVYACACAGVRFRHIHIRALFVFHEPRLAFEKIYIAQWRCMLSSPCQIWPEYGTFDPGRWYIKTFLKLFFCIIICA